jgi:hypothetical protein
MQELELRHGRGDGMGGRGGMERAWCAVVGDA